MDMERLKKQMDFILEIDKEKNDYRYAKQNQNGLCQASDQISGHILPPFLIGGSAGATCASL